MVDLVRVPGDGGITILVQSPTNSLVQQHGAPRIEELSDNALGRLEGIVQAAEQLVASVRERLNPTSVELEVGVALSAEVGWFVAKSTAEGSVVLKLAWGASSD